eukprot:360513-Chlamydomonas_euryale.AAC.3
MLGSGKRRAGRAWSRVWMVWMERGVDDWISCDGFETRKGLPPVRQPSLLLRGNKMLDHTPHWFQPRVQGATLVPNAASVSQTVNAAYLGRDGECQARCRQLQLLSALWLVGGQPFSKRTGCLKCGPSYCHLWCVAPPLPATARVAPANGACRAAKAAPSASFISPSHRRTM